MRSRIVFVHAPAIYMNYHQTCLARALRRSAPDWSFVEVMDLAGPRMAERLGECAAADALVLHSNLFSLRHPGLFADGASYMKRAPSPKQAGEISDALCRLPARRLLLGENLDLHGDYGALGIRPEAFDAVAWFFYPRRFTAQADPWLGESWLPDPAVLERNYAALLRIPTQVEMAFCLDASEFVEAAPRKLWRLAVPGVSYRRRRIARAVARAEGFRQPPFGLARFSRYAAAAAFRAIRWREPTRWSIDANRRLHHGLIARSEFAYTDGSAYGYPVRKFIEIPAQRTPMLCTPHPGMADRGFRDGVTHIACEPEEAGRLARRLDPQSAALRAVADAGFDLVRRLHSAEARAAHFIEAVRRFARGALSSACFSDGEFVYRP